MLKGVISEETYETIILRHVTTGEYTYLILVEPEKVNDHFIEKHK